MGFPGGSVVKNHLPVEETQETQVRFLGQEDPLEEEMETHSSIPAWEIPQTEGPGRLSPWGHKRVRHDLVAEYTCKQAYTKYVSTSQSNGVACIVIIVASSWHVSNS